MMELCQGNGCSYQLWSIMSSIVLSELRTQGFGINFVDFFRMEISQLLGLNYVDDCDMIRSDDDIEDTHSKIQLVISKWEDLSRITGGCLAPDKSAWYFVDYK